MNARRAKASRVCLDGDLPGSDDTRQLSVRRDRVAEARRWLSNCIGLDHAEAIVDAFASLIMSRCVTAGRIEEAAEQHD